MADIELAPEVFTTDYAGEPGRREFFVQARGPGTRLTFRAEKQQVQVLAEKLRELLLLVDESDTVAGMTGQRDPAMTLEGPLAPDGRVGAIALAYEEASDQVIVLLQRDADEDDAEPDTVRLLLRRDQARAFVLHALAVVGEGRPLCPLCNLPIDPGGHRCPAENGHRVPDA